MRASATANSIPKYVLVVIYSNGILKVYDTTKRPLELNENPYTLMTIDLNGEGISPYDVLMVEATKQTHNSYRRDNSDLRPEDIPGFTIILKNQTAIIFQVNVIDKSSALGPWKNRHRNDVRYLLPSQTANPPQEDKTIP